MRLFKYGIYCGSCQADTSCAGTMLVINLISCPVLQFLLKSLAKCRLMCRVAGVRLITVGLKYHKKL